MLARHLFVNIPPFSVLVLLVAISMPSLLQYVTFLSQWAYSQPSTQDIPRRLAFSWQPLTWIMDPCNSEAVLIWSYSILQPSSELRLYDDCKTRCWHCGFRGLSWTLGTSVIACHCIFWESLKHCYRVVFPTGHGSAAVASLQEEVSGFFGNHRER